MAVTCPRCLAQYDITLFEFGRKLKCDCGLYLTGIQEREAEDSVPEPREEDP